MKWWYLLEALFWICNAGVVWAMTYVLVVVRNNGSLSVGSEYWVEGPFLLCLLAIDLLIAGSLLHQGAK